MRRKALIAILILLIGYLFYKGLRAKQQFKGELLSSTTDLISTEEEDSFWSLVSVSHSSDYGSQIEKLDLLLSKLDNTELEEFQKVFDYLRMETYDTKIWEIVYAINMGCSDDCFDSFRTWLIGQGKDKFYLTLKNPGHLLYFGKKELVQNYEGLYSVGLREADRRGIMIEYDKRLLGFGLKGELFSEESVFKNLHYSILTWLN